MCLLWTWLECQEDLFDFMEKIFVILLLYQVIG